MDLTSIVGLFLGVAAIIAGQILEGGHFSQIVQFTAFLIVVGGTLGATFLSFTGEDLKLAINRMPLIFSSVNLDLRPLVEEIFEIATIARKEGILAIEARRAQVRDPLLKKSLKYIIDGFDPRVVKEILDSEIEAAIERDENAAKVFEGAGGYAPTIGIIGAVLGLIHVMNNLEDPSKIGPGIAVAFVATIYGVGLANLILLPWAKKLKRKAEQASVSKELIKLGVLGIQEGLNPHFLKEKLEVHLATE